MAIPHNFLPPTAYEEMIERMQHLENLVDELSLNLEDVKVQSFMKDLHLQHLESLPQKVAYGDKPRMQRLILKNSLIDADNIMRGNVNACYDQIKIKVDEEERKGSLNIKSTYIGASSDLERRLREHMKEDSRFEKDGGKMKVLYGTSRFGNAADMESRLLLNFGKTRNTYKGSTGLVFGKPSYFFYMLRFLKR